MHQPKWRQPGRFCRTGEHCCVPSQPAQSPNHSQMTCLFWFQSADDLHKAESIYSIPATATLPPLPSLAKPYEQFRKWVLNVLQTTQVTQNVILLALLFIYRLKMSTPQIKGRAGSEYRLLTVALMLGNKCKWPKSSPDSAPSFYFLLSLTCSSSRRQHLYEQDMGRGIHICRPGDSRHGS